MNGIAPIRGLLQRIPRWFWYAAAGTLITPWLVRYFLAVLGQGCDFVMPAVGR